MLTKVDRELLGEEIYIEYLERAVKMYRQNMWSAVTAWVVTIICYTFIG